MRPGWLSGPGGGGFASAASHAGWAACAARSSGSHVRGYCGVRQQLPSSNGTSASETAPAEQVIPTLPASSRQLETRDYYFLAGSSLETETRELVIRVRGTDPRRVEAALDRMRELRPPPPDVP